jgi:hypothetical protein
LLLAATLAIAAVPSSVRAQSGPGTYVVHEWGTFTTRHGPDGIPIRWNPLVAVTDLPRFVYGNSRPKPTIEGTVRMETPVLYFYADQKQTVSVDVGFPGGVITEWYPQVRRKRDGVRWPRVTMLPGSTPTLPREDAESHYYPARETDATPLRSRARGRTQHEKFLFYRGVGTFDLPLSAHLDGAQVVVNASGAHPITRVLLFERRGASVACAAHDLTTSGAAIARAEPAPSALEVLETELMTLLRAEGLYEREAQAMLNTWREVWSEEGLRVLYIVPRAVTDAVLPLTLDPPPASLVRVLVGRVDILDAQP